MSIHSGVPHEYSAPLHGLSEAGVPTRGTTPRASAQSLDQQVCAEVAIAKMDEAIASGGHGKFKAATVVVDGKPYNVFLKPFDKTEHNNLAFLQEHASPELQQFLPHMYGTITLGEEKFLVLEDLLHPASGEERSQLVDAKLAGGKIADQEEMKATRGEPKTKANYEYMKLSQKISPEFMISKKGCPRPLRVLFYPLSKNTLAKTLDRAPNAQRNLEGLQKQLETLQRELKASPMAFIGASVVILQDNKTGEFTVKLIDPAHAQANPDIPTEREVYKGNSSTGNPTRDKIANSSDFGRQREANLDSVAAMVDVVKGMRARAATISSDEVGKSKFSEIINTVTEMIERRITEPIRKTSLLRKPSFPSFSSLRNRVMTKSTGPTDINPLYSPDLAPSPRASTASSSDSVATQPSLPPGAEDSRFIGNLMRVQVQAFGGEGNTLRGFDNTNFTVYHEILRSAPGIDQSPEYREAVALSGELAEICTQLRASNINSLYGHNPELTGGDWTQNRILAEPQSRTTPEQRFQLNAAEERLLPLVKKLQEIDARLAESDQVTHQAASDVMRGSAEYVLLEVQQLLGKVPINKTSADNIVWQ